MNDLCECEAERAAIMEHDADVPRDEVERIVLKWTDVAPRCDECPKREQERSA